MGIGERAKKNIESLIRKYCPEYTYDKLEEDHEITGYEGNEKEPPLFRLAVEYTIDEEGLTADTHFIASTGIGGCALSKQALVSIDFFSVEGLSEDEVDYLHALDYLNPTHEYGVAFERGTRLCLPEGDMLFISGTASINNKGECLYNGDVLAQTERLFLNIDKLLADKGAALAHLKYIIVYQRDVADARVVEKYLQEKYSSLPY